MNLQEMGDNLIIYIKKYKPKKIFIDITAMGLPFHNYVEQAIKNSATKLVMVHGIRKTDGMAFRKVK